MNNQFRKIMAIAPLVLALTLTNCGSPAEEDRTASDSLKNTDSSGAKNKVEMNQEFIGIPAPSEMLNFLQLTSKIGLKNTEFLNLPDNIKNYTDNKSMAINFGIYSCDLTYCSIFKIGTIAGDYFKVVKTLGEEIGVSSVITPQLMKRAESNINNSDSLSFIADDIYYSSSELLEANGKGATLALVIAGGYIESLNIACNVIKFDVKNPAVSRFADQKYNLDQIVMYLKKYESDAGVAEVKKQIDDLKAMFDQLKETTIEAPKEKKNNHTLGGAGTCLEITKEQFSAIGVKIKTIRNNFAQLK